MSKNHCIHYIVSNIDPHNRDKDMQKKPSKAGFYQGWSTTDEQEIERRRQRGEKEPFTITPLEEMHFPFGAYRVESPAGSTYDVEIRTLNTLENSCGCPDFSVNGLGTCKHIEGVIYHLQQRYKKNWDQLSRQKPTWMEVFVDVKCSQAIKLWNPIPLDSNCEALSTLPTLFSSNNTLHTPDAKTIATLREALQNSPEIIRRKIRISKFVDNWVLQSERKTVKFIAKQKFLEKVQKGEESLNILKVPLYSYQEDGMLHLAFNERALLADEMGLGKTIQAIAACELLRRLKGIRKVLLIAPASLKTEWEEQILKFTDLPSLLIQGPRHARLEQYKQDSFFYLMNYEQVRNDIDEIQELLSPDVIILDEAQRIKNWQAKTSTKIKKLKSPYAFVLTGTPVENRIDEIYSLMQVIDPTLFGPLFRFNRDFYVFDEKGKTIGLKNIDRLHSMLKDVLLRRRKSDVEDQLPERLVNFYFVKMEEEQRLRYSEYEDKVARLMAMTKSRPMRKEESDLLQLWLACMRMLCDTPYILDQTCKICPKLSELEEILAQLLANKENKIIIFSEWVKMLDLVQVLLKRLNIDFALHIGSVPQDKRRLEINRFKGDPNCRVFLSSDSGATGLNLQVANVVINLDLPWNPAKYEQRIARAWRKHQKRAVQVINLVCEDSIEQRMIGLLSSKQALADGVLEGIGNLAEMDLPSGKGAFLEKLEALMGFNMTPKVIPELVDETFESLDEMIASNYEDSFIVPPPEDLFKDEILKNFSKEVVQIDLYQDESGKKTLLAISNEPVDQLQKLLPQESEGISLTVVDSKTFETIQKLIEAGILQLGENKTTLYQSQTIQGPSKEEVQRRLHIAQGKFQMAERKFRMASVLVAGGFAVEAEAPAREALDMA
ncbi:MAG: DEAD/DEAH box helicase, partial [Parachlamydiaceae bacterium]|nr:DEAD/DEAH box helicase [Parachlamydiaceae bacterium]